MNALVPLHFEASDVRMVMLDDVPWWVGMDVTKMLGVRDRHQALDRLEDYERGRYIIPTPSGDQEAIIINESGVYSLLFTSRKPIAKAFKRWLTTEVLPAIRKFGMYPPPAIDPNDAIDDQHSTPQQRFLSECARIAEDHGVTVRELLKHIVSPSQQRAIELGHGPMVDLLHRDQRWLGFMGLGMDLQFVLHGRWGQTPRERALQKQMRAAAPARLLVG